MPVGYDSYLYGSLCQSDEDNPSSLAFPSSSSQRRRTLGDSLPQIHLVIEGHGRSVVLRVKPHVRWMKVLSRWTSTFENPNEAPMAWPVVITVPSTDSSLAPDKLVLRSIQESISRTVGPELLARLVGREPGLILHVGQPVVSLEEEPDVTPPDCLMSDTAVVIHTVRPPTEDNFPEPVLAAPDPPLISTSSVPLKQRFKLLIQSDRHPKGVKMAVSGDCTVERLIRKFGEATSTKLSDGINMQLLLDNTILQKNLRLQECLPSEFLVERGTLILDTEHAASPATVKKRKSCTPLADFNAAQFDEMEYWSSAKKNKKTPETYEDDELALAIALSLSEQPGGVAGDVSCGE